MSLKLLPANPLEFRYASQVERSGRGTCLLQKLIAKYEAQIPQTPSDRTAGPWPQKGEELWGPSLEKAQQQTAAQQGSHLLCNNGLKITPQRCHPAVLNHTEQHVDEPLTKATCHRAGFAIGKVLVSPAQPFRAVSLPAGPLGSKLAQGCGLCWEGSGVGLPCCCGRTRRSPRSAARHLLGGGSVGSPTRGTPGTHSARLSSFGISRGFAEMGCAVWGPEAGAPRGRTARRVPQGGGGWEGIGSPYRSRPPSGSGDTWAWCRLGWARDSARTGYGMLHAGPAEVNARPPRPAPPSAAQMCGPPHPDVHPARS